MTVKECMKTNVVFVPETTTIGGAAALMVARHVDILPIVDGTGKPMGIVRMGDLLTLEMPDFISLIEDFDFVHDFGVIETTRPQSSLLKKSIKTLMKPIETIEENCGLLRAYALLLKSQKHDLPVIDTNGTLVGVVSRVDIGTAILSLWDDKKTR